MRCLVAGSVVRPVIERCCRLEATAEARACVGKGHKRGGAAITV